MSFYETAALYGLIALGVYACAWLVVHILVVPCAAGRSGEPAGPKRKLAPCPNAEARSGPWHHPDQQDDREGRFAARLSEVRYASKIWERVRCDCAGTGWLQTSANR